MSLSKDQLKSSNKPIAFHVPSLNEDVLLRRLTVGQRRTFFAMRKEGDLDANLASGTELLAMSIVSEDGSLMLTTEEVDGLDGVAMGEISQEVLRINGFLRDAVKDAEKNSEPNPSE